MATPDFVSITQYASNSFIDSVVEERYEQGVWLTQSDADKTRFAKASTSYIDRLPIVGYKTVPTQKEEFPRGGDEDIPYKVAYACALLAIDMSDGASFTSDMNVIKEKIGDAEWGYGDEPHNVIDFPNKEALALLSPWIRDSRSLDMLNSG